jgi:hypothetical protein
VSGRGRAATSIGLILAVALVGGCDTDAGPSAAFDEAQRLVCEPLRQAGITFEAPDPDAYARGLDHAVLLLAGSGEADMARAVQAFAESARADVFVLTAFLMGSPSEEAVNGLRAEVESREDVAAVDYVSQAEEFESFVQTYEDQPQFYESVPRDVFPASLRIEVEDVDALEGLSDDLEENPLVDEARYSLAPGGGIEGLAPVDKLRILRLCSPAFPTEGFPGGG